MQPSDTISDSKFVDQIRRVLGRVESLGVSLRTSRFGRYRRIVEDLASGDHPRIDAAVKDAAALYESTSQLRQLYLAAHVWDLLPREILVKKLKKIVKGSILTPNDNGDDLARNTLLELVTASMMHNYGFDVTITHNREDVIARKDGLPDIALECKRPASSKGLPANLSRLRGQTSKTRCPLAIVVVGGDRLIGLTKGPYKADDEKDFFSALETATQEVIDFIRGECVESPIPKAPVGAVVMVGSLFLASTANILTFASMHPFPTASPDGDAEVIRQSITNPSDRLGKYLSE